MKVRELQRGAAWVEKRKDVFDNDERPSVWGQVSVEVKEADAFWLHL